LASLRDHPEPSNDDIEKLLDRNVCRCGTYPRIVTAVKLAADRMKAQRPSGARR
jgi:aerobic-type carbon monoxide dehydrogenase small subunit (CoxS/CutS family)